MHEATAIMLMGLCDEKRPLNELQVYRVVGKKLSKSRVNKTRKGNFYKAMIVFENHKSTEIFG